MMKNGSQHLKNAQKCKLCKKLRTGQVIRIMLVEQVGKTQEGIEPPANKVKEERNSEEDIEEE